MAHGPRDDFEEAARRRKSADDKKKTDPEWSQSEQMTAEISEEAGEAKVRDQIQGGGAIPLPRNRVQVTVSLAKGSNRRSKGRKL
jgi:hypothetical protein